MVQLIVNLSLGCEHKLKRYNFSTVIIHIKVEISNLLNQKCFLISSYN